MKRNLIFILVWIGVLLASSSFIIRKNIIHKKNGGGVIGLTNSPGENNCAQCHGGGTGSTLVSFNSTPSFTSNFYIPGQTYTIDVIVTNSNFSRFGLDAEILTTTNANAGSMATALPGVQFATSSNGRKNATQTTPMVAAGSGTFSFVWVAPLSGLAKFYASGNAVNGNGNTGGDRVGVGSMTIDKDTTSDIGIKQESKNVIGFSVFPNPVISEFKINYSLVNTGEVKVAVCDLQGKEILQILNEKQNEGYHSVIARIPENLSKGVYMLKLYAEETPLSRLIIIQ